MDYVVRPYRKGEEKYVADAHRRVYSREYRWGEAFVGYAAGVAESFAKKEPGAREGLWVAENENGGLSGCIMLCETEEYEVGQLRLFLVEKDCRRCGVGSALTKALFERARQAGYKKLMLWSASPLVDAIRQYERLGFKVTQSEDNTTWSLDGETLQEIKMEMELR